MAVDRLLCPVPVSHVASALSLAAQDDAPVAFGSGSPEGGGGMWEFFGNVPCGTPMLIYVSQTGLNDRNRADFHGPVISLAANYERFSVDRREVQALRPDSTATDSDWQGFWVCSGLHALPSDERPTFASLGIKSIPRGPRLL